MGIPFECLDKRLLTDAFLSLEQLRKEFEMDNEKLDEETLQNIKQLKIAEANVRISNCFIHFYYLQNLMIKFYSG